jgi:hypothetical protein
MTGVCEIKDADGDKRLAHYSNVDGKEAFYNIIAGTGKYEGVTVTTGKVEPLGPFPVIKDGTSQGCNHRTGTYKIAVAEPTLSGGFLHDAANREGF